MTLKALLLFPAASLFMLTACQPAAETVPAERPGIESGGGPGDAAWLAGVDLPAFLDCVRVERATLLQAHRAGDRPGAAENSLMAIEASLADGAVFAEMDVSRTADGVLVLMHDRTVDRTTTGTGPVSELTLAEISAFELVDMDGLPTGERVPTLAAALAFLDGRGIAQIDLKTAGLEEIATALEAADAVHRAVIISYSMDDALAFHERLPGVMISVGINSPDDITTLREADADLSRFTAWLGLGSGNVALDQSLAEAGLETSYGDFRAERDGTADYRLMASNGAEVISVDDVPAAAAALNAGETARSVLARCEAAR